MMRTFDFAMIVALFARVRGTVASFMYDMPSDRVTRSMSLAHLILSN
jgi:hypothetical protein